MTTRFKILTMVTSILFLAMNPSWASDQKTVNLRELIDEALQNNPEIKGSKERWEATKAAIPQAGALEDPLLSVMFDKIPDSSVYPGDSMERQYSISQGFPFPGKLGLMGKMADKEARMSFEEYRVKERNLVREVKTAYYDWFMICKSIDVDLETKEILHHLSRIAEARYATGLVSQVDVLKAQIELSQLANEIIILNQEKESVMARINMLMNRPLDTPLGGPAPIEAQRDLPSADKLEEMGIQERPEIKGMTILIEKEETGLELARKGYYPDFMVKLAQREEEGRTAGWIAEFGVTVPLWFRSKQDNAVSGASSRVSAARYESESRKKLVSYEIRDALVKLKISKGIIELYGSTHIPLAEQALKGAMAAYETGKVNFFSLMESWKSVKGYKLDYYKALATYEQGWANLERAVGREL